MRFYYIPLVALGLVTGSLGDDMTLRDGRELHGYKVLDSGVDFVRILHDEGISTIPASNLTDEWQELMKMTPAEVDARKREVARRNKEKEQAKQEREAALRQSLSESEKVPRYIQGSDVTAMLIGVADIYPVEAEAIALRWNIAEAKRVGLSKEAVVFQERLQSYSEELNSVKKKKEEANAYWTNLQSEYEQLKANSDAQITTLKKQVSSLKDEVDNTKTSTNTQTVIYSPPVYVPTYLPPQPPVIVNPAPVRVAPQKPVPVTKPIARPVTPVRPTNQPSLKGKR